MERAEEIWAQPRILTQDHVESPSPKVQTYVKSGDAASHSTSSSLQSSADAPAWRNCIPRDKLKQIANHKLVEAGADYAGIFYKLQIRPDCYDQVVTGILHPIRRKRMKNLEKATDAMIRELSYLFLRGYCNIIYHTQQTDWLIPDEQLRLAGKKRLQFTPGHYEADGPNAHFYHILEPMWWKMREICFERKTDQKKTGQPRKEATTMMLQRGSELDSGVETDADNDTELDNQPLCGKAFVRRGRCRPSNAAPKVQYEERQRQTLTRIEQEINLNVQDGVWEHRQRMTADETDQAVQDLILRLHDIRCNSNPSTFARSWSTNLGRLEEIEGIEDIHHNITAAPGGCYKGMTNSEVEDRRCTLVRRVPNPPMVSGCCADTLPLKPTQANWVNKADLNLANEPFNTHGTPSPLNQLGFSQTLLMPSTMSLYITTAPSLHPYKDKSYHWPDAPVSVVDGKKLFDGIDLRVAVRDIVSYTFSYGWNDVMRLVENDEESRRHGFSLLRQEMTYAAKLGITKWRLKVLVCGRAPWYVGKA